MTWVTFTFWRLRNGVLLARKQPLPTRRGGCPSPIAFTCLLQREPPDTADLRQETRNPAQLAARVLVLDDPTPDKPYTRKIDLVTRHWIGKQGRVVWGINLLALTWSGLTRNDYLGQLLRVTQERGFVTCYVLFDNWYPCPEKPETGEGVRLAVAAPIAAQPLGSPARSIQYTDLGLGGADGGFDGTLAKL